TGRDEVAESREPRNGQRIRALGETVARDLREPARDEAGLRVLAVAHAIDRAGAGGDDVLERAAELDANDVCVRVHAEHRRADEGLELASRCGIEGCDGSGRGRPGGDLTADLRPARDRVSLLRWLLMPKPAPA